MTYKLVINPVLGKKYIDPFFKTTDMEQAEIRKDIIMKAGYTACKGTYEAVESVYIVESAD